MRSIRLLAVTTGALLLGSACGGDNGGVDPDENDPPVAGFTEVCTELSCVFTDTSTDPDGDATITAWSWNFDDGTTSNAEAPPAKVYAAAGTYTVVLTVTDDEGATDEFTKDVTVTATTPPPPVNTPPTASFTVDACPQNTCAFTSTSTDADGTIASYAWNFGDGLTSTEANPTHTYAAVTAETPYTVTLTVTDDDGAASAAATQTVTIQPPAPSAQCVPGTNVVDCTFDITQRSTVTITLTFNDCELGANRFDVVTPRAQTIFFNGCLASEEGTQDQLRDAGGAPMVFEAGTQITTRFTQGVPDAGDPPVGPPAIIVDDAFPTWTLNIDDGGNAGGAGEPNYTDIVLTVQATPAP